MARSIGVSVENSFVNGLITEASSFNFPENAVTDCDNVVFDERGIVSRRLGFEYESGYTTRSVTRSSSAISQYLWRSAAGNGENNFVVVQIGATLYFYRIGSNGALSSNSLASTVNLATYEATGSPGLANIECQFASGYGKLFVTHPHMEPIYVTYDPTSQTFSASSIEIKIRDFDGLVDETTKTDERPTTLSSNHLYNLVNQGWDADKISIFQGTVGVYPSNADVWWLFKNASEKFLIRTESTSSGELNYNDATLANNQDRGNSPAPKGAIILSAFYQDRSSQAPVTGIPVVSSSYFRPGAVEFYTGRVFYAGVQSEGFNNRIYFSRIIENTRQFGLCHQDNDPSSEFSFDLLPSDGGVIVIPEAGTIIKLVAINASLVVFASNGIWAISGSDGSGFKANDYTIKKLSTVQCLTASNFIDVAGIPCWWNLDGIYMIQSNEVEALQVQSLTEKRIRAFFESIPPECKKYVKGAFNTVRKTIHWLYRSTSPTTVDERYEYDRVLCFNTMSGAFYPWSINTGTVKLHALVSVEGQGSTINTEIVTNSLGQAVTDAALANVTVQTVSTSALSAIFKYLVSQGSNLTFSEVRDGTYKDWVTATTGVNFSSFFVTGYKLRGEGLRRFQENYVRILSTGADPSSYYIQAIWDWANNSTSGRYSSKQRINHTATPYGTHHRKIKLRGHGVACQFKVSSVDGESFDLLGWVSSESVNEQP